MSSTPSNSYSLFTIKTHGFLYDPQTIQRCLFSTNDNGHLALTMGFIVCLCCKFVISLICAILTSLMQEAGKTLAAGKLYSSVIQQITHNHYIVY